MKAQTTKVETFTDKVTNFSKTHKVKKQFKELRKTHLADPADPPKWASEPAKDATMFKPSNEFRQWQKHFMACYTQSKMGEEDANLQRSFHDTCIDDNLINIIVREVANKNPKVYAAGT